MTITSNVVNGRPEPEKNRKQEPTRPALENQQAPQVNPDLVDLGELTLTGYQLSAHNTAIYPGAGESTLMGMVYLSLKLNGEAGEVAEKFGKLIRDKHGEGDENDRQELKKELGDVLWYVAMLADELGFSLEEVAQANLDKLNSRKERGVLGGSGDNR